MNLVWECESRDERRKMWSLYTCKSSSYCPDSERKMSRPRRRHGIDLLDEGVAALPSRTRSGCAYADARGISASAARPPADQERGGGPRPSGGDRDGRKGPQPLQKAEGSSSSQEEEASTAFMQDLLSQPPVAALMDLGACKTLRLTSHAMRALAMEQAMPNMKIKVKAAGAACMMTMHAIWKADVSHHVSQGRPASL